MGGVLREIEQYGYLIKCGKRAYLYDGPKGSARAAIQLVKDDPQNAGSTVRYRRIV